ncbi:2-C-methyl-D-erythritol 4-phosphate cytidylyltransferase, partial [Rhizobium hidalgonense]
VIHTVSRDYLWQCQTPQMFRFGMLKHALQHAKKNQLLVTDEASAIELQNLSVKLVAGSSSNIKITYPEDLALAAAIMQAEAFS